jgi:glycosyltransferase involved in cell wall biosynthesis
MCKHSKGILVDSELGKQQVLESYHANAEKIHVLPFVAPGYLEKKNHQIDLKKIYGLPQKFLFYPAQFWEHKNHKSLVNAVGLLKDRIPDIHFVFVGAPKNAYQSIKELIRTQNLDSDFTFLDYIPDDHMAALYRNARGMIMPTFFGPTNIPPLEAFATGCPAAVSNIYDMPSQVDGAALLFDPHSITEITNVIERMWTDDHLIQQLKLKGHKQNRLWNQTKFNVRLKEIIKTIT